MQFSRILTLLLMLTILTSCDSSSDASSSPNGNEPGSSIPWNTKVTYGNLCDPRDGKCYRTIEFAGMEIMAENLRYEGSQSNPIGKCYDSLPINCAKYGRLYSWTEAINSEPAGDNKLDACPTNWHIFGEWTYFLDSLHNLYNSNYIKSGDLLKSTTEWIENGNGSDMIGLRILPSGICNDGICQGLGSLGVIWNTGESSKENAWEFQFKSTASYITAADLNKQAFASVRCAKD